jgi:UDP:flavonoid glycosyltransferase YjiC (YdhE family)
VRVLFTPMAWPTHYYQMVGVVWALRAAGHEVMVAGQPGVLDAVTGTGTAAVSVGGGYDLVTGVAELVKMRNDMTREAGVSSPSQFPPELRHKLMGLRMVPHIRMAEDMAGDLVAFAERWRPDLVITDPLVYAAPLAAAAAGAPLVRHLWGLDAGRHVGLPGTGAGADDARATWPEGLLDIYARYGVEPRRDVAVRTVDNCPPSMQFAGVPNRIGVRYTSYNGTAVVPAWTLEPTKRQRVCVTWGALTTSVIGEEAFLVPRILGALAGLDVEVVVTVKPADRATLGQLPDSIRVVEAMPLDLILPRCAAIIHQSGAGSTLAAAALGVPQLTIPQIGDQSLVSARLAATGAGIGLAEDEADAAAIAAAVTTILSTDGYREGAERLRDEILAQPAPADIVDRLEELV